MTRRSTLTVTLLALLLAAPAGAAAAEPSLAITISDGVEEARTGDTLDYTATVSNRGGETFEGVVTITPPPYLMLSASDADAIEGGLSWEVSIPAGESRDIRATATVGEVTGDDYQVVVTAAVAAASAPVEIIVRAADADRIPGVEAPAPVTGMTEVDTQPPLIWAIVAAGAVVIVVAIVGLVVWLRRRPRASN